ncbi:MAG: adenosylcobinamide-GDP ribazoletransferase, partial [Jaaginema sp. PMC 1079.18]|nr:adenosylcobinamide-GDP ribazoletransferase [Jaaginema sp. PMC 1079.18]
HLQPRPDLTLGTLVLLLWLVAVASLWGGIVAIAGFAIALLSGYWFNRSLGGQTGDTYGAIVEVTEALLLVFITLIPPDAGGLLLL